MGGAFVSLADDVHAATWNPAGLAWQKDREISYSVIFVNRDDYVSADFISDDYAAYAQPVSPNYKGDYCPKGGMGIYYHNSGYKNETTNAKTTLMQPGLSYGRRFSSNEDMAWGISLSYYLFDSEISGGAASSDTALSLNLGYLWNISEKLTAGFLLENVNEPTFSVHGVSNRLIRVFRPGIAYYFTDATVATLDIYDLTGNTGDRGGDFSQNIRMGFEHYFNDVLSVRLGLHQPNSKVDSSKYYSLGFGLQKADYMGIYPINYYLDYTFIYWQDPASGMEDYTHQAGLTLRF